MSPSFIQTSFVLFLLFYCSGKISTLEHPVFVSGRGGKQINTCGLLAFRCSIWTSGSRNMDQICLERCVLWHSASHHCQGRQGGLLSWGSSMNCGCWQFICIFWDLETMDCISSSASSTASEGASIGWQGQYVCLQVLQRMCHVPALRFRESL